MPRVEGSGQSLQGQSEHRKKDEPGHMAHPLATASVSADFVGSGALVALELAARRGLRAVAASSAMTKKKGNDRDWCPSPWQLADQRTAKIERLACST